MVSLCLSHQATSTMCNMTCSGQRGSPRDLEVRSNFQIDLSKHVVYDSTRLNERNTMASQLFSYLSYMKFFFRKITFEKYNQFDLDDLWSLNH